ncbi:MAG: hypothetical protein HZC18_02055 [Candidatus Omnitrophica bacterium]|nr:hypothetical protein [Candidatus Omnitrophota bacterium]
MNKKTFTSLLILPIFFWAILCCCLERSAVAVGRAGAGHCHSPTDTDSRRASPSAGHNNHSRQTDECQCHKIASLSSRPCDVPSVSEARDFLPHDPGLGVSLDDISRDRALLKIVYYHGPPRESSSAIPVYLRHCVLRL